MKAITFFTLLSEANKQDVFDKRWSLTASTYPHVDADQKEIINHKLLLHEDVLNDILPDEEPDDINILKEALNGK